jgi:hypothetical protein
MRNSIKVDQKVHLYRERPVRRIQQGSEDAVAAHKPIIVVWLDVFVLSLSLYLSLSLSLSFSLSFTHRRTYVT